MGSVLNAQPCEEPSRWVVCGPSVMLLPHSHPTGPSLPSPGTFPSCCSSQGNGALLQTASIGLCFIDLLLISDIPMV